MATKKAKRKTKIIAIGATIVVLLVAIVGFLAVRNSLNQKNYQIAVEEGKKYFADKDFENAILAYEAAIEANPESEEAVVNLANSYIEIKDYNNAKSTLRFAIDRINSPELEMLLARINFLYYGIGNGSNLTQDEINQKAQTVSLNKTIWKNFGTYTYGEYKNKFPDSKAKKDDKGQPIITNASLKRICYFENSDSLESNGNPKANAFPSRIELSDLGAIFDNLDTVISNSKLKEIFSKKVVKKYDDILGCNAIYATYDENTLVVACDDNGNIISRSAPNYILVGAGATRKCMLNGKISDATTGKAVKADLEIVSLSNSKAGKIKIKSNEGSGAYSQELDDGKYKIVVQAEGYIETETEVTIEENQKNIKQDIALSPALTNGEIRIVLEWGASPKDLDCFLIDDQNHRLYFGNKKMSDSKGEVASLDVDDRNGRGPETVTIYRTDRNYRYTVNDFGNENKKSVQNSNATIKVYMPGKDTVIIKVPDGEGSIWEVLEINKGELKIVNEMRDKFTSFSNK